MYFYAWVFGAKWVGILTPKLSHFKGSLSKCIKIVKYKKPKHFFICLELSPFLSHKCTPKYSGSCPSAKLSECFRGNYTLPPGLDPGWSKAHQSYLLFTVTVREDRPKPGSLNQCLIQKSTWSPIWVNEMQGDRVV